jgi:Tol biopolymer transport system component
MRAALVAVLVATVGVPSAGAARPGPEGEIVFVSSRGGRDGLYAMRSDGSHVRALARDPGLHARWADFSADGRVLAYVAEDGLWVARADASRRRRLTTAGSVSEPDVSPAGRVVAYSVFTTPTGSDIWVAGVDGRGRRLLAGGRGDQSSPSWAPDGRRIAYTSRNAAYVLDLDTGGKRLVGGARSVAWSPDGRLLALARRDGVFAVSPGGGGRRLLLAPVRGFVPGRPAWSPDGRRVAVAGCCTTDPEQPAASVVQSVRRDGRGLRRTLVDGTAQSATWARDGRLVYSDQRELWTIPHPGGRPRRLFPPLRQYREPAWSADGHSLAFTTDQGLVVARADGTGGRVVARDVSAPSWAPDGRRIAVEDVNDGIDVIPVDGGDADHVLVDDGAGDTSKRGPDWSPRGDTIAYRVAYGPDRLAFYDVGARRSQETAIDVSGGTDWRPDGRAIAFTAVTLCGSSWCDEIRLHVLGTAVWRRLIPNASSPSWSPDSRWLAFVRRVGRDDEIFVARADGSDARRLTTSAGPDLAPAWRPRPR